MGIDNILERISVGSEKEAEKITAEARAKATEIYAERTAEAKIAAAAIIPASFRDDVVKAFFEFLNGLAVLNGRAHRLANLRQRLFARVIERFRGNSKRESKARLN